MTQKLIIAVAAITLACAPTTSTIQPLVVPGVDESARRLLGTGNPWSLDSALSS